MEWGCGREGGFGQGSYYGLEAGEIGWFEVYIWGGMGLGLGWDRAISISPWSGSRSVAV